MKIDMHVHSHYSRDSSINFKQIKNSKMDYICLTDHDSYNWDKFKGLNIINGVEKTITEENGNKFHLLCYFLNEEIKSNT
jgi:predicted metal-dependent phosphoesterase TrpH